MRIARAVMVVLLVVGAFSLFLAAERLWHAHHKLLQDEQLAALANARSDWYEGIVALSFERSVTQVALSLDSNGQSPTGCSRWRWKELKTNHLSKMAPFSPVGCSRRAQASPT